MKTLWNSGLAGLLVFGLATPALAHGGGGGGGSSGSGGSSSGGTAGSSDQDEAAPPQTPQCAVGYAVKNGACVKVSLGVLPDADLYAQGRALALAGHYAEALPVLEAIQRTDDPMVFTMRGFAVRKLGHFDQAMVLYRQALALDPGNVNTHEYVGEGYVTIGRKDLARVELVAVRQGCGGTECEQYEDLERAIDTGVVE